MDASVTKKSFSAEASWLYKIAEKDFFLRSRDELNLLFKKMFHDSRIVERFTLSRQKASYVIRDGLSPLLVREIYNYVRNSTSTFTLMFDETTTKQNKKQMDVLLRYFSKTPNLVETRYLLPFFFTRAPADFVVETFQDLQNDKEYNLRWDRLFNISSDGPNINKSIWQLLNDSLTSRNFHGLLEFNPCTLRKIHNAFHKGIVILEQYVEGLVFDLHQWFKYAPCKEEDFVKLDDITIHESLFLRHLSTRWLTLSPAPEKILARWSDTKTHFLSYIPSKKKQQTRNKMCKRIVRCLKEKD